MYYSNLLSEFTKYTTERLLIYYAVRKSSLRQEALSSPEPNSTAFIFFLSARRGAPPIIESGSIGHTHCTVHTDLWCPD